MGFQVRATLGAAVAATLLIVSGCSGDDGATIDSVESAEEPTTGAPAEPELPAFDPPTKFDAATPIAMPGEASDSKVSIGGTNILPLPVALSGTTAFIASVNQMLVVDTTTGETLATVTPELPAAYEPGMGVFVGSNPSEAPLIAEVDGAELVLVPIVVTREAVGTEKPGVALELLAVDAVSLEPAFTTAIDLPDWADDTYNQVNAVPLGVSDGVVALKVTGGGQHVVAVDLATHAIAWEQPFEAHAIAGDTIIGWPGDYSEGLSGLAVKDGTPKWQGVQSFEFDTFEQAGPNFFVAMKDETLSADEDTFRIIDAETGTEVDKGVGDYALIECRYDGMDTTVCFRRGEDWAGAFDANTGEWLWSLPGESTDRVAPMVTTVWHGAVYGLTDNGPVVLDGRTGEDLEIAPGAAPYLVNEYVGIADDEATGGVAAFPATA
jgi:hypothetical protein